MSQPDPTTTDEMPAVVRYVVRLTDDPTEYQTAPLATAETPPETARAHFLAAMPDIDPDRIASVSAEGVECEWFALCDHQADRMTSHPAFPAGVPTCARCAAKNDHLKGNGS